MLLADLLQVFALLPQGLARSTRQSWAPLAHATLRRQDDGAVLTLEKTSPGLGGPEGKGGAGVEALFPGRLEIHFDQEARIRMTLSEIGAQASARCRSGSLPARAPNGPPPSDAPPGDGPNSEPLLGGVPLLVTRTARSARALTPAAQGTHQQGSERQERRPWRRRAMSCVAR